MGLCSFFIDHMLFSLIMFFSFFNTLNITRDTEQPIGSSSCVTSLCFMRAGISHNQVAVPHKLNGESGLVGYSVNLLAMSISFIDLCNGVK